MYKRHPRLTKFWQKYALWSLILEGTLTWWCSDDTHHRERKLDHEIRLPKILWRPYCWKYGHEPYYNGCVTCDKALTSRAKSVDS